MSMSVVGWHITNEKHEVISDVYADFTACLAHASELAKRSTVADYVYSFDALFFGRVSNYLFHGSRYLHIERGFSNGGNPYTCTKCYKFSILKLASKKGN